MSDYDKRRFPRVNYPCSLTVWQDGGVRGVIMANTANIGIGGLCVHLNQKLRPQAKVEIKIDFPRQTTPFKCLGQVLRCDELAQGPAGTKIFYTVALQFEGLDEIKQAFLRGAISELIALENKKQL